MVSSVGRLVKHLLYMLVISILLSSLFHTRRGIPPIGLSCLIKCWFTYKRIPFLVFLLRENGTPTTWIVSLVLLELKSCLVLLPRHLMLRFMQKEFNAIDKDKVNFDYLSYMEQISGNISVIMMIDVVYCVDDNQRIFR